MSEPAAPATPADAVPARASTPPAATARFEPFVPASVVMRELTSRAVILGALLGIVFAASSVYLGLKVGLTVSASIPIAVLAITLFRWLGRLPAVGRAFRGATILENNIVQTTGSAGESIAAGVAFTLPSLLLMGFEMELGRILLVAVLGGLIGVLMMIPLRRGLIVEEHGRLAYPEGTACADVLIVGEQGGTNARTVFLGFFVGGGYAIANLILRLWSDVSAFAVDFWGRLKGATVGFEVSPPMLGVGYIIGPRVASNMLAGGLLAFVVLIPLIRFFGDGLTTPMYPETAKTIAEMSSGEIRNAYVLYIGAGAVATGGFVALVRAIPTIASAFRGGMRNLRARREAAPTAASDVPRTDRDLSMRVVVGGSLALAVAIWLAPVLDINLLSAALIVLFGFFFVTVSSRITGQIGSSSNPISGMTVATLLLTCGLFVLAGWTGVSYKAMALTTAALVCVAASNGGTISQDLKTGFLVGGTPRAQQIAILFGVVSSALVIGFVLRLLDASHATFRPVDYPDYRVELASDAPRERGPDGGQYAVHFVREETAPVPRGKYLATDDGRLAFLVDPGVCGTYPYRLAPADFEGADRARLLPPADAPTELGLDRRPYRVVTLAEATERDGVRVPAGRYLVDADGRIAYVASDLWKFDAPKAQLFRLIIDGTLGGQLPWGLVLVGVFLALLLELIGIASLPFAVGLYLPIYTSGAIFVGGLVRWLVDRRRGPDAEGSAEMSPGVLTASGLIAGGAIAGVVQAVVAYNEWERHLSLGDRLAPFAGSPDHPVLSWFARLVTDHTIWPLVPFLIMAAWLYRMGVRRPAQPHR
ncbi:MAG: oligopeptide transporter, OPT family [Myxococcota bacterium]|nr:oligopeptide transporter, OPT family [Myxococcota bacterium]